MSLQREYYDGPISFQCDNCNEIEETHCMNFNGALAKIKSHGWVVRLLKEQWHHYCKDCK
jgi:hypothetical protein